MLTVNEFRRLFDALLLGAHRTLACLLHWSTWRRRHQHRARQCHYHATNHNDHDLRLRTDGGDQVWRLMARGQAGAESHQLGRHGDSDCLSAAGHRLAPKETGGSIWRCVSGTNLSTA